MRLHVPGRLVVAMAASMLGSLPAAAAGVRLGSLECHVRDGVGLIIMETERMNCTFAPIGGSAEKYVGTIRKYGLTVGAAAGTVIVWAVVGASPAYRPGSLAGDYKGVSADAAAGLGVGADALVGGPDTSIALQPVSVRGQSGLDIAVAITEMELDR
jgi:hypothetical protein